MPLFLINSRNLFFTKDRIKRHVDVRNKKGEKGGRE